MPGLIQAGQLIGCPDHRDHLDRALPADSARRGGGRSGRDKLAAVLRPAAIHSGTGRHGLGRHRTSAGSLLVALEQKRG